jgi:hypothetical protein
LGASAQTALWAIVLKQYTRNMPVTEAEEAMDE